VGALPVGWLRKVLPGLSPGERLEKALAGGWREILLDPHGASGDREWTGMIQWIREGPMKVTALQAGPLPLLEESPPLGPGREGPASPSREGREAALEEISRALEWARAAGCPRILVRPGLLPVPEGWMGDLRRPLEDLEERRSQVEILREKTRDQALDRVCRLLHGISLQAEGALLCLRNGFDLAGLDRAADLRDLAEDLGRERVRIWVDTGAATARELAGDEPMGELLEEASPFLEGLSLGDVRPGEAGLLPGMGRLDLHLVADYLKAPGFRRPWVLEVGLSFGWDGLELASKSLEGL